MGQPKPTSLLVGVLALGLAPSALASESQLVTHPQGIAGGYEDVESHSVVGLSLLGLSVCSATLISPNVVLTAQHCVARSEGEFVVCGSAGFNTPAPPNIVWVHPSPQIDSNYVEVAEVLVPSASGDLCGEDIALVILDEPIERETLDYYIPRVDVDVVTDEAYSAVGYGHTGAGFGSGLRRRIDDRSVTCVGTECPSWQSAKETEFVGTGGTCQGDSGGPALDSEGRVIGVVSRGPANSCSSAIYSSVPAWGEWIREVTVAAAEGANISAPPWATAGDSSEALEDGELDGVRDFEDNCPLLANPSQSDTDGDGRGDLCDTPETRGGDCAVCDPCFIDADCRAGICVQEGAEAGFCTQTCGAGEICPADSKCSDDGFCVAPSSLDCREDYVCLLSNTPSDEGCAASGQGGNEGLLAMSLALLGLFRRRRDS